MTIRLLQTLTIATVLSCGFMAGYSYRNVSAKTEIQQAYRAATSKEDELEIEWRTIKQNGYDDAIRFVADCTLDDARAERCFIPCTTDADCVAKNGMSDH